LDCAERPRAHQYPSQQAFPEAYQVRVPLGSRVSSGGQEDPVHALKSKKSSVNNCLVERCAAQRTARGKWLVNGSKLRGHFGGGESKE